MNSEEIKVMCPKCGQLLPLEAQYADRNGKCPHCDEHFMLPLDCPDAGMKEEPGSCALPISLSTPKEYRNFAWRRWTARQVDFVLGYILTLAVYLGLAYLSFATQIGLGFWSWLTAPENQVFDLVLTMFIAYFSSTAIYAIFGQTLGKKICGVRVCDVSGKKISAGGFLGREFNVLIRGECLGIPLLYLIAVILQYNRVAKGEASSYDEKSDYQARPVRAKAWYDTLLIFAVLIVVGLLRHIDK